MLITGIKSRPTYDKLTPFPEGRFHVVAGQGGGGKAMLRLLSELGIALNKTVVLYSHESFSGKNYASELRNVGVESLREFSSNAALIACLHGVLTNCTMGTRLYLSGSESFIGTAMQVASQFGLNADEVLREDNGTFVRRVWCVHCDTYTENVTKRVFNCPGCHLDLVVRDHYSSRLAAFMGVKADAEQTGVMPLAEDLDT